MRLRSLIPSTRHLQVNWQQARQRYENLGIGMPRFHGLSVEEKKKEKEKGGRHDAQEQSETRADKVEVIHEDVSKNFLSWILRVSCRDADLHEEVHLLEQDIQVCHHFKPPAVSKKGMLLHYMHA